MLKQNLILTGWSKSEYLAAAAAAFEALKADADIAGVSMEALAGVLSGDAAKYKTVYVLGIGLTKNKQSQGLCCLSHLTAKSHCQFRWMQILSG